ncbi:hypothetical protein MTO96_038232 [Rhipicephalus appendiculatus]
MEQLNVISAPSACCKIVEDKYREAVQVLRLAEDTVRHMKMGATSHWRPCQAGFLISTSVVLSLSEELLDKHRYRYVLTGRLVQDCIENISVLRLRKPVPTACDVKCALKLICVGQFLRTPKSTSYEVDDSLYLTDLLGPTLKDKPSESEDDDEKLDDLFEEVTDVECDILAYFGGFLVKALLKVTGDCQPCRNMLVGTDNGNYNTLIDLKEYVQGAHNLLRPSNVVMSVLLRNEERLKGFVTADTVLDLKAPHRSICKFLERNVEPISVACDQHQEKVSKGFLEKYVRSRLRMHLRQQKARSIAGHSSKRVLV